MKFYTKRTILNDKVYIGSLSGSYLDVYAFSLYTLPMPVGKQPFMRYKIINACLTNKQKPYPSLEEIKSTLATHDIVVDTRSIERDLEAMRHDRRLGYNAPIAFCRRNRGYHYTDADYTIDNLPLTPGEIEAFALIVESLKSFRGAAVFNSVAGIFDKLDKVVMHQARRERRDPQHPVADFEKVPYVKGIEHFDKLYHATTRKQPVLVTYRKFNQPVRDHVFHPYLLKEYRFLWYVLGYSERSKKIIILALDRIETISNKKVPFKDNTGIDLQKYFDHTIGVTLRPGGVKEVQLWCSVSQGHYFKTQPLHPTQQIVRDDEAGLVLSLQLIPNYELLQTLLAFGAEVKVLKPLSLQQEVKEMISRSTKLYSVESDV
ncbi:WYL domain-containing protein [Chryseolinea sp. H1M3-3]|uniref:helix-turn-helix transcriptional regulator n=1 Tax=Chryseolinea sp. H1M3-3 TaxID=3034144 RepID=UPI0023ED2024|nr:WYL domain-containing protein [Chryseolinea sp. H1M3-3]